jgi:glycosyltransferase involved in cell wall biosynthesis
MTVKKLKVLQIIPSFGVGGAEKLVLDYLTYFDKDKVEIKAISMYGNKDTIHDRIIKEKGLDVIYLNKKPGLDLSMVPQIRKVVKEFKPNIIHTHMNSMKYVSLSVMNNREIKLFHTIHNEPEKDATGVDKILNTLAFKYLGCTPIALSDELIDKVNSFYDVNHTIALKNGIYLDNFKNIKASQEDIRNKLNLPEDSFVIGHVGRFSKQKNHDYIVDIFKKFSELNEDSYLILVGDGELKSKINQKVEELGLAKKVRFLGIRQDIPELIKCMDVFLFPSFYEGFPITLIEAQATGVRCVISDSIDKRAVLSDNTVSLGLDEHIERWCKVIKDNSIKGTPIDKLDSYDIKKIIKELEELYRKSFNK